MKIDYIQRVKGVFNGAPANFPKRRSTGAAVIGNGDLLAAAGGEADKHIF